MPIFKNLEPLSTCLVWKITRTPLPVVDRNNHLSKQFLSLFYKWKALAHVKYLLSSAKGLSFTFMLSHHPFFEHFLESIVVILSVMCLSQNTVYCGITLMLVSLIFLLLVFSWTSEVPWHLCFVPQIKESEIPPYHILLWALQSCKFLCFMLLIIGMLVFLHSLHDYEVTLVAYFLLWVA
jgi:hypothetical protein